ncbi:MAG: EAL domain-containing protein [Burkholderiales bacterium]|nr:EAL domain-containing protein [Burkholderiales bacterium]
MFHPLSALRSLLNTLLGTTPGTPSVQPELLEYRERFRAIFDHAAGGMAIVSLEGKWLEVNDALCRMLGYERAELLATSFREITHPQDFDVDHTFVQLALSGQIQTYQIETRYFHKEGREIPILVNATLVRDGEGQAPLYFILRIDDITQRKKIDDALFAEKDFAQTTLQSIGDAVMTTDVDGKVNYLNPVAERMTGWSKTDAAGQPVEKVFAVFNETTRVPLDNPVAKVCAFGRVSQLPDNALLIAASGTEYSIEMTGAPIRVQDGTITGAVLVFRDVTQARALSHKISYQASHDALTGLWNRSEFEAMTTRLLHSARVMQLHHALLFLDLDQFKTVNDTCGHEAGDQLLRQLSNLLLSNTRKSDMLARLGGDEFAILLDSCPLERATEIAQHLVDVVRAFRFEWEGKLFSVGVSIGLIPITSESRDLPSVLRGADAACYMAKEKGRNRVQVYEPSENEVREQHEQLDWVERLTEALEKNRFVLHYQKVLPIASPDAVTPPEHVEILLRYPDDKGRLLLPMAFIPAAERYSMVPAIDRWVIAQCLHNPPAVLLDADPGAFMAINLSGASINEAGFQDFVVRELKASGLDGRRLCFEITETAAVTNLHRLIEFIYTMKLLGCHFSLDDFGSGMSSFGYLKSLPVDFLKIDGGLVKGIAKNPVDHAMVTAIHHIATTMGIKTIAKFVENEEVLQQLVLIGVNFVQGYGIHRPEALPAAVAASELIA